MFGLPISTIRCSCLPFCSHRSLWRRRPTRRRVPLGRDARPFICRRRFRFFRRIRNAGLVDRIGCGQHRHRGADLLPFLRTYERHRNSRARMIHLPMWRDRSLRPSAWPRNARTTGRTHEDPRRGARAHRSMPFSPKASRRAISPVRSDTVRRRVALRFESLLARVFRPERRLSRLSIVSGTHAIVAAFDACCARQRLLRERAAVRHAA